MNVSAFLMLVSGGLFAGGVSALAWDRIPAWRNMPLAEFRTDFAGVVQRADRVQPGLLVVAIVASFAFGLTDAGAPRILALIGASGFLAILTGSIAVLVPLQRRMISSSSLEAGALERMRHRWFRGHLGRTLVGVASFLLVASATAV
ncbi:MAG TPA: anthrone oxygenase family protein [Actinomycetota bacterium]|nr:anthrone oxygenase family protein [Actinomycetota bacterium]